MIKNIRYRVNVDGRGKIKSGEYVEPEGGKKGHPKALDYFNVSKFPELLAAYGKKPTALLLFMPSNMVTDCFDCNYVHWGGGRENPVKKRSCDGETCTFRIDCEVDGKSHAAGDEAPCVCKPHWEDKEWMEKQGCRYVSYLKSFIALPQTGKVEHPQCYLFETHSQNSGDAIFSELEKVWHLNQKRLIGVPFILSIKMISGKSDAKKKFPLWNLSVVGTMTEIESGVRPKLLTAVAEATTSPAIPLEENNEGQKDKTNELFIPKEAELVKTAKEAIKGAKTRSALLKMSERVADLYGEKKLSKENAAELSKQIDERMKEVK